MKHKIQGHVLIEISGIDKLTSAFCASVLLLVINLWILNGSALIKRSGLKEDNRKTDQNIQCTKLQYHIKIYQNTTSVVKSVLYVIMNTSGLPFNQNYDLTQSILTAIFLLKIQPDVTLIVKLKFLKHELRTPTAKPQKNNTKFTTSLQTLAPPLEVALK